MSTPAASFSQFRKLDDLLGNPSSDKLQYLLANGDLLKLMYDADLARVDRAAFKAVLTPAPAPIVWRPVSEYAEKITEWNRLRDWGFTTAQVTTFAGTLVDHLDPLHPTGISLWLGRDLPYNWEEVMACLKYEVEALGEKFTQHVDSRRVSFLPGSEQSGGRKLAVVLLDLATYWHPTSGEVASEVRTNEARLPGLEVAWLLALNAPVYLAIDYETMPGLIAAGLVIDSGLLPYFSRDSGEAFVSVLWDDRRWHGYSVVAFME